MSKSYRSIARSALVSAAAIAAAASAIPASGAMSAEMQQKLDKVLQAHPGANKDVIMANMQRVAANNLQKCFGVNAAGKNDCASGNHACSGMAKEARSASEFVLLPAGDCDKIAGGSTEGPM